MERLWPTNNKNNNFVIRFSLFRISGRPSFRTVRPDVCRPKGVSSAGLSHSTIYVSRNYLHQYLNSYISINHIPPTLYMFHGGIYLCHSECTNDELKDWLNDVVGLKRFFRLVDYSMSDGPICKWLASGQTRTLPCLNDWNLTYRWVTLCHTSLNIWKWQQCGNCYAKICLLEQFWKYE